MGNTKSQVAHPLALVAVARQLSLQRSQIVILRETLHTFTDSYGYVTKKRFLHALKRAKIRDQDDLELFELLFTMWDHSGREMVPAKLFCVGIAPLACPRDDLLSVLRFTLHVCEDESSGTVGSHDVHDMLCGKKNDMMV